MPFGELIPQGFGLRSTVSCYGPPDSVKQLFTGKERDSETGLDFLGARYYSSSQGRFTSPDQAFADQDVHDPQSWNLYSYVRNNPLNSVDPTGQDCVFAGWDSNGELQYGVSGASEADCKQQGGTYVNGTVDPTSFTYNARKNILSFSYSTGDESTIGSGHLYLPEQPDPGLLALKRAGEMSSFVTDPKFIVGFYVASASAGLDLIQLGLIGGEELTTLGTLTAAETTVETAVPQLTGQLHHAISNKVFRAIQRHPLLKNLYKARDPRFVTRAKDLASHSGYQKWHRQLDEQVVNWVKNNPSATPAQFESYLKNLYNTTADLVGRFPNGLK
jgi:RHS repeat-associated protein